MKRAKRLSHGLALLGAVCATGLLLQTDSAAAELPTLHLRKATTTPQMVSILQDPSQAGGWYPSSPMWFGDSTGNHVEFITTYDDQALYIAFDVLDYTGNYALTQNSTFLCDRCEIWVQTPEGRTFWLAPQVNGYYPAGGIVQSGTMDQYDVPGNVTPNLNTLGWTAGGMFQQTVRIPWSDLGTRAPALGSRWHFNFVNFNQTDAARTAATLNVTKWAPGDQTHPDQWGTLAFDEAKFTPPSVSPEATLTLRPASGFGSEVSLSPGDNAQSTNYNTDAGIVQSNWNDWDSNQYNVKEFMQFDLSMIPKDRTILSAVLDNHFRAPFEDTPTDLYVHVERLAAPYVPGQVTMQTSPLPVENGDRELVRATDVGNWVNFDVSDIVAKAFASGASKVSLALTGTSGDVKNGKVWDTSWGYAPYYDTVRPRLHITFGKPGVTYAAPIQVGSLNSTSVAGASDKNKLTNGTFRYGAIEGISNTTYWQDAGSIFTDHNTPLMLLAGDVNPITGDPAMRFTAPVAWRSVQQTTNAVVPGQTYTLSCWTKGSQPGVEASFAVVYQDAAGNQIGSSYYPFAMDGNWSHPQLTLTAPAGTVSAVVSMTNWTSGPGMYVLYSDMQLEAGTIATSYSETTGVYYPDYPRVDGVSTAQVMPLAFWRFHNPINNEEFYTDNPTEKATVATYMSAEGVACQVYAQSIDAPGLVPLRRFYNPIGDAHFWSADPSEIAVVSRYMRDEGIVGYVFPATNPSGNQIPLYRAYNPHTDRHLFTTNAGEYNGLSSDWNKEGAVAYVLPAS